MRAEIGDLEEAFLGPSDSRRMILTCPQCATGYFVDDVQIGPGGRAVRCAACGARWTASAETPLELSAAAGPAALAGAPEDGQPDAPLTGDDLPRTFRNRAEEEKRLRQAAVTGAVWAGVAVGIAAAALVAVLFRGPVVGVWPQTASVYAAIGLPVNPIGLVIEDVRATPSLQQGHAALAVSGLIRNVEARAVTAPALRITLFNGGGRRIGGQIATLANPRVPPGATRHFVTAILDPPFSAQTLQVDFAMRLRDAPPSYRPPSPPTAPMPSFTLRGPDAGSGAPAATNSLRPPAPVQPPSPSPANAVQAAGHD
ncbi:MAG TPA: MJ0042-type zinc finger domain-containing protein [Caulobacteraceae bacterium]|nr:MJ0042-type zinc finger domain-containing protein [Caulobacteraceae bacterium]